MRKAADRYTALKQSGRLIPNEDIFIPACGIYNNYPLFMLNRKHFEKIADLIPFWVFYNLNDLPRQSP